MKANELRIGNIINCPRGDRKVKEIGERGGAYYARFDELQEGYWLEQYCHPIPLTNKLLLKCGFEKCGMAYIRVNPNFIIDKSTEGQFMYRHTEGRIEVKYLHQLQNVYYCITGKELLNDNE